MIEWIQIGLIVLALTFFVKKSLSEKSNANSLLRFFQYGDDFKQNSFFATLVASNSGLSGAVFLIIVYGYFYGMGIFPWVLSFWVLTQIASVYTIKKVEQITKEKGGFISKNGTLHEFLGMIYNSNKVRIIAGAFSTLVYIGLVAVEIVMGYEILRAFVPNTIQIMGFELVPLLFLFIISALVFFYTSRSGFRAVVSTDKIQLTLILLMITCIIGFVAFNSTTIISNYGDHYVPLLSLQDSIFNPTGEGIMSFMFFFVFMNIIFWAFWWPAAMDQWHRVAATKSIKKALNKGLGTLSVGSVSYFALLTFVLLAVGIMIKIIFAPTDGATQPLFYFLTGISSGLSGSIFNLVFGAIGIGLITLGLIAILISTIDTYLVVAGQSFVSDILLARKYKKSLFDIDNSISEGEMKKILTFSRKCILLFFIPVISLFFLITQLADVFTSIYFFFAFQMAPVAALIVSFVIKRNKLKGTAIFWSIIGGGIWAFVTNIALILTINDMILAGSANVMFYYNLLYANPAITAVVTVFIYFIFPRTSS